MSAHYLSECQKDEFKEYAEKMIEMARQNETGVVGGAAATTHSTDNKTATVPQKEGGGIQFVLYVNLYFKKFYQIIKYLKLISQCL